MLPTYERVLYVAVVRLKQQSLPFLNWYCYLKLQLIVGGNQHAIVRSSLRAVDDDTSNIAGPYQLVSSLSNSSPDFLQDAVAVLHN